MKGWRPEGWVTLKAKHNPLHCLLPDACVGESFEAGADALLKALCTDENRLDCIDQFDKKRPIHKWGWLVYIPDRKEEG